MLKIGRSVGGLYYYLLYISKYVVNLRLDTAKANLKWY